MSLTMPKNEGGSFELAPAGNHLATCVKIIDLGTQKIEWEGTIKQQRKIQVFWELPGETMEDGRPFLVAKRYTLSSHEKSTLRKDLEAWRGRPFKESDFGPGGFVIRKVLGIPCMVQVVHNSRGDKTYANVASVGSLPKGMQPQDPINETVYFSLEPDEFDRQVFEAIPDHFQNIIQSSPEYHALERSGGERQGKRPVSAEQDGPDEADDNPF